MSTGKSYSFKSIETRLSSSIAKSPFRSRSLQSGRLLGSSVGKRRQKLPNDSTKLGDATDNGAYSGANWRASRCFGDVALPNKLKPSD